MQAMLNDKKQQLQQQLQGSSSSGYDANLEVAVWPCYTPGMSVASSLQQLLPTGSLDTEYGIPEIEACLEIFFQALQSAVLCLPWNRPAVLSWQTSNFLSLGIELVEPDSGCWPSVACHVLLTQVNKIVFQTWPEWAGDVLQTQLPRDFLSACSAACLHHPSGAAGAGTPQEYLAACLICIRDMCRLTLTKIPEKQAANQLLPRYASLVWTKGHDLQTSLMNDGLLANPTEDTGNLLQHVVHQSVLVWMQMKAVHPLLTPAVSPIGQPCPAGRATIDRQMQGRSTSSGGALSIQTAPNQDCMVVASLCPAASFMDSFPSAPAVQHDMNPQDTLVLERVVALKLLPSAPAKVHRIATATGAGQDIEQQGKAEGSSSHRRCYIDLLTESWK